jgi:hypothetical protein
MKPMLTQLTWFAEIAWGDSRDHAHVGALMT